VSTSHPSPALHVFSSTSLEFPLLHVLPILTHAQPHFRTIRTSARILIPHSTIFAADADKYAYATSNPRPTSTSAAIMDTAVKGAVDISSGVWSGVKALGGMALDAANRSTGSDSGGAKFGFSKSVPSTSSPLGMLGVRKRLSEVFGGGSISRIDESGQTGSDRERQRTFVTVVDLMPLHGPTSSPRKVAEFRWANHPRTNYALLPRHILPRVEPKCDPARCLGYGWPSHARILHPPQGHCIRSQPCRRERDRGYKRRGDGVACV
jgi:hypothetical protein